MSKIFCGECICKIVTKDSFVTCNNCTLDFHVSCVNVSDNHTNHWLCNSCFFKSAFDELPFSNDIVDLNCKLQKGLKIVHINIQSLVNKLEHIKLLLDENQIHILCITETWLTNNIDDCIVNIDGYNMYRMDRSNGKLHGGLMCYIKDGIAFKQNINLLDNDIEAIWIEVNMPKTKPILIGTVYRPPDSHVDYVDKLDTIFQQSNSIYDDVYNYTW